MRRKVELMEDIYNSEHKLNTSNHIIEEANEGLGVAEFSDKIPVNYKFKAKNLLIHTKNKTPTPISSHFNVPHAQTTKHKLSEIEANRMSAYYVSNVTYGCVLHFVIMKKLLF